MARGDFRLGMFDAGIEHSATLITKEVLKSLGVPSARNAKHSVVSKPTTDAFRMSSHSVSNYNLRSGAKQADDGKRALTTRAEADMATPHQASTTSPASTSVLLPPECMPGPSPARRPRDVWQQFMEAPPQANTGMDDRAAGRRICHSGILRTNTAR